MSMDLASFKAGIEVACDDADEEHIMLLCTMWLQQRPEQLLHYHGLSLALVEETDE